MNGVSVLAKNSSKMENAQLLNRVIEYYQDKNDFKQKINNFLKNSLLYGFSVIEMTVKNSGKRDDYNRMKKDININIVDPFEILLDPTSVERDYSDARFFHRTKICFLSDIPSQYRKKIGDLGNLDNLKYIINGNNEKFSKCIKYNGSPIDDNSVCVITSSYFKNADGIWKNIVWCGDVVLHSKNISSNMLDLPYYIYKTTEAQERGYIYGEFHSVYKTLINQCVIENLMNNRVYDQKILISGVGLDNDAKKNIADIMDGASLTTVVDNLSLTNVMPISKLQDVNQQILKQEKRQSSIQNSLSLNDSVLGYSRSSDSGKKVQLHIESGMVSLTPLFSRFEGLFVGYGKKMAYLIIKHFKATQEFPLMDKKGTLSYFSINKPMQYPVTNETGELVGQVPVSYKDEEQVHIVNTEQTSFDDLEYEMKILVNNFYDTYGAEVAMLNDILNGSASAVLAETAPDVFLKTYAESMAKTASDFGMEVMQNVNHISDFYATKRELEQQLTLTNLQIQRAQLQQLVNGGGGR